MLEKAHEKMTQMYSTFGDKLLQHTDVLNSIQNKKKFKPITVQLCPTERCDLNCHYCSVGNRDKSKTIPLPIIKKGLKDFRQLGAKALEITGGGNPLLYYQINEVIDFAYKLGYDIGIITNAYVPLNHLLLSSIQKITWIRISMSALDFDIDTFFKLGTIPKEKLGLSYIINKKTTENIIQRIAHIASKFDVKFVRLAPDCLNDDSLTINKKWNTTIDKYNREGKLFIKEINDNFYPYSDGCYVGMVRPYWNSSGVYMCSSHVLETKNYEPAWKLCDIENIKRFYKEANEKFKAGRKPYDIELSNCYHCYYYNNNKLLHTVATELPDRNFA